jgi:CheY-like chemotaxis protein
LNEGDWIQISIQDQGPGIGEAVMDRIFDPYFSTKPRGNQKGMGLGLPVADAIVRNHGGYIDMASRPGKGTDVKIILPAWQSDKTNARAAQSRARARKTEGPSRGKRVLVMDDERGVRMLTERVLQRMGCDTEAVSEGRKAIEAYKQALDQGRPFDAVILDLTNKDGMGGLDALKGLQKIDPAVKAVVASGYSADPVMREFRANGFRGAVTKPFDLNDFEQLMKDVLEEPGHG